MPSWSDRLRRPWRPRNAKPKPSEADDQPGRTAVAPLSVSPSRASVNKTKLKNRPLPEDLWQSAYDQLGPTEQSILSEIHVPAPTKDKERSSQTTVVIDEVIRITEERYEKHQQRGIIIQRSTGEEINLRHLSRKIINAALSFKDIMSAVVTFDPTNHAASAWAVVSLALTMTKNRFDLLDALFDSSEYLADVLTRCAYVENNFYRSESGGRAEIGHAIVRVYIAILQYTAEVFTAQKRGLRRWILDSVTAITTTHLLELRSSVKEEEQYLHQWIQYDQYLQHGKEAECILAGIDKASVYVQGLIKKLNLPIAEGAFFDSYMNQHEDLCLPATRTELRCQISKWAESPDSKCIFWLNGMAGTGKSTIARTVAQSFKEKGQLGASFFFKNGEADRGNARRLIPTIVKQLMTSHPQLATSVLKAIEDDPDISTKSLREQFNRLLLQPLLHMKPNQTTPVVIVIDALDECEQEEDIRVILQLLPQVQNCKSLRLLIFLTSRPELPIRLGFEHNDGHQDLILHELPHSVIEHDIRLFLEDRFSLIKRNAKITGDWPGIGTIDTLVMMAVPLFVFAATICRFVEEGRHPQKRLQRLLNFRTVSAASQTDNMYLPVLDQLLYGSDKEETTEILQEFRDVVGVIILLADPLSVNSLSYLLDMPRREISDLLDVLHSVLKVPSDMDAPVRILHLSFRDYLLTTNSVFRVEEEHTHRNITLNCLRVMNAHLKHNICDLSSYGIGRMNIGREVLDQHLSADLQYACRYWAYHLERSKAYRAEMEDVFLFLRERFLHWLEAMSLMGVISETLGIIHKLQSGIWSNMSYEFSEFLNDSKRFIRRNIHIIDAAPLQLYCSALVFSPMRSTIRRIFINDRCRKLRLLPQVENSWNAELQTLEGHSSPVQSVAFAPDSQMLASASWDTTVRLWDASTGRELQSLKSHSSQVHSVAFSRDNKILASGSGDGTIILWDAMTGKGLQILKGHLQGIQSVAFSPDNTILASGSLDKSIKLWDAQTGKELQTLKGFSYSVASIVFSPDSQILASASYEIITLWDPKAGRELQTLKGPSSKSVAFSLNSQVLASGSVDGTIRLWNTKTGKQLQTLRGHSFSVETVSFSPDGQILASASFKKIILWDAKTGEKLRALQAHHFQVLSLAFSPDSSMLASGSFDNSIKLWDVRTLKEVQPLEGHTYGVESMAFSPNNEILASGSDDETIKLWDVQTGKELQTLKGHSDSIQCVAFSPDSGTLASGSEDNTLKLWDAKTGKELQTLSGHLEGVKSVAFSPNNEILASGSYDKSIKLWDAQTGKELQTLKGHSDSIQCVAFSPDSRTLASGSKDNTLKLWDAKTGSKLLTLEGHSARSMAFSPNSQVLASDSTDGTIKLWDAGTGKELQTINSHLHEVRSISFAPDHQSSYKLKPQVSMNYGWVAFEGEKLLWLPSEYRYFSSCAIKDSTLALGYDNGRVFILGFNTSMG